MMIAAVTCISFPVELRFSPLPDESLYGLYPGL